MRGRLLLLALLSITGAIGLVASGTVKLPNLPWTMAAVDPIPSAPKPPVPGKSEAQSTIEETTAALGLDAHHGAGKPLTEPVLDVSRISRDGISVFAGRAAPNSYVTILEDGKPAGTAHADDNGSWSLSTDHKFASLDPKLTFRSDSTPAQTASIAAPSPAKTASPAAEVMQKFEGLVADAREHAKSADEVKSASQATAGEPKALSDTATSNTQDHSAGQDHGAGKAAEAGASASARSEVRALHSAPIPVPIMFVYNEAQLTPEGHRAVTLLLEYVKLEHLPAIELSGHADERGTDGYNIELSRERLEAVARILREGGYEGELKLKAKGKSEPFMGVDRSKYTKEALYQLDRRVELHIVR